MLAITMLQKGLLMKIIEFCKVKLFAIRKKHGSYSNCTRILLILFIGACFSGRYLLDLKLCVEASELMSEEKYSEANEIISEIIDHGVLPYIEGFDRWYFFRASIFRLNGDWVKSIDSSNIAIKYNPKYSDAYMTRAEAL